jgi:DNA-binding NarL/FixJ family response regulator
LKLAGASYAQIAQQLGYSDASGARKAVQRGMKSSLQESGSELKKIHYGRLEHMLMLLWPDVNTRDLASMSAALAVMDRMERLYGLNAAEKLDIATGRETVILADGDKESYIKALEEAGRRLAITVDSSALLLRTAPRSMNDQEIVLNSIDVLHKMLQTPPPPFLGNKR